MNKYNHLIYYAICEILFDERKKTNYNSFHNMCASIKTNISHGEPLSTEQYKVIATTMSEISYLYGLSDDDTVMLLNNFFNEELWVKYTDIVAIFKSHLKNCYL
jgi:hypothetical protein